MANPKKAIFYPTVEGEIKDYYDNAADKLNGAIGTKYGTDPAVKALLMGHKANMPIKKAKAFADEQTAQQSFDEKDSEFALGKVNMLLELERITRLPNWDENDAEGLGIRKVKTPVDLNTVKGKISKTTALPEMNVLDWIKAGMEGIIIEGIVEAPQPPQQPMPVPPPPPTQDSPGWKALGTDQKSPYEDKRLNKTEFPENRYYRIRYIKDDKPVGVYSDIVKVVTEIYPPAQP